MIDDAVLERRRALRTPSDGTPGFNYRTIIAPDVHVMFVSLNKNACTSLKWAMARVCGEDTDRFTPRLRPYPSLLDSVHDRSLWQRAPKITDIGPDARAAIRPGNGWFVFAVVRNPQERLFSAWQNKLLLDHPGYVQYRQEPWYPRHPATLDSIVDDFERFVRFLEGHPNHPLRTTDGHFRGQSEMLMLDTFEYSRLYDLTEMRELQTDLNRHLVQQGWTDEVMVPRSNDTPLRPTAEVFADGVGGLIERLYTEDYDNFAEMWSPHQQKRVAAWSQEALDEVEMRAEFGRRLADLRGRAIVLRDDLVRARRRVRTLQQTVEALERRLNDLAHSDADVSPAADRPPSGLFGSTLEPFD